MTNKFELICTYCGYSWGVNYAPLKPIYCIKCKDSGIKVIDTMKERVDYYEGSPDFKVSKEDDFKKWYD